MTRKQAITKAITALHQTGENAEAIRLLQDLSDELPLIHWSDKSIRDTVEQFIQDNGRPPTASDFKKAGMFLFGVLCTDLLHEKFLIIFIHNENLFLDFVT